MTVNLKSSLVITYSLWNAKKRKDCCSDGGLLLCSLCNQSSILVTDTKRCCHVIGYIIIIGLPLIEIIINIVFFKSSHYITVDHEEFSDVSCNLIPNYGHFYVFFPLLFILLLLQLVCILAIIKLLHVRKRQRRGNDDSGVGGGGSSTPSEDDHNTGGAADTNDSSDDEDNLSLLWKTTNISARFWITVKFTITHTLVWIIAFLALIQASIALWHVFTLLNSLQAIYITVNCTFTRPVLDLIYQWREEKLDYYKHEHSLYSVNHLMNTSGQNESKRIRK
uniref:Uncharacterized protein n=1 Tax=Trichobilharzia regenti TaxID=157069 RepID=A0AA85JBW1_TRIRE|nr:unnamed protein product [Trichobilharzia regenti]